jgi:hypothetical protein
MRSLQEFAAVHSPIRDYVEFDQHLNYRERFKESRAAALRECKQLAAPSQSTPKN